MGVFLRSRALSLVAAALVMCTAAWSQEKADYTKASPFFPNVLAPYQARQVPPVHTAHSRSVSGREVLTPTIVPAASHIVRPV